MYSIALNAYLAVAEESHRLRQYLPLSLFHNASLQCFGGIPLLDFNRFLQNDRSCVTFGGHYMNRCSRDLYTLFECRLMNMQSVKSLSAERGDKCGVYI